MPDDPKDNPQPVTPEEPEDTSSTDPQSDAEESVVEPTAESSPPNDGQPTDGVGDETGTAPDGVTASAEDEVEPEAPDAAPAEPTGWKRCSAWPSAIRGARRPS